MRSIQKGNAVSHGIGIGRAFIYKQYIPQIEKEIIDSKLIAQEIEQYKKIKEIARTEITQIKQFLQDKEDSKSTIFDAHIEMLNDPVLCEETISLIKNDKFSYPYAVKIAFDKYINMLSQTNDQFMKERVIDLKDVRNRLLRISEGVAESNLSLLDQSSVIIAKDLYPSDTATLDRKNVQAIITEIGGMTSHTAIIAKSYEIPAILGVDHLFEQIVQNEWIIVDANEGNIIIHPDLETIEIYKNKQKEHLFKQEISKRYLDVKASTKDETHIEISLNIGSASQEEIEYEKYVDGVGLFRSEFLYMDKAHMPTEDQQFEVYKKTLLAFKNKPVVLRSLDIGGDKKLSYLEMNKEDNPFLGNRAIRLSFTHIEMFKTQIRAALRASMFGNLWLMFPMVGSMDDIYQLKSIVKEVENELTLKQIEFNPKYKFGIMIEIPSIIMIADHVAEVVDFASIGTNDLCQYLTAVDRMNPMVSKYYQSYAPSMFRVIKLAIDAFEKAGKPISVCGESAGDLIAAPILIGLGIRKLSMNKSSIASIKHMITSHTMDEFNNIATDALALKTEADVIAKVKSKLHLEE